MNSRKKSYKDGNSHISYYCWEMKDDKQEEGTEENLKKKSPSPPYKAGSSTSRISVSPSIPRLLQE